jgi:hypothetical protein
VSSVKNKAKRPVRASQKFGRGLPQKSERQPEKEVAKLQRGK